MNRRKFCAIVSGVPALLVGTVLTVHSVMGGTGAAESTACCDPECCPPGCCDEVASAKPTQKKEECCPPACCAPTCCATDKK
jgi:hypothetical protein